MDAINNVIKVDPEFITQYDGRLISEVVKELLENARGKPIDLGPLPPIVKPNCRVTYYVKIELELPPIRETLDVIAASHGGAVGQFWREFNPSLRYDKPVMSVVIEGVERI